MNPHGLWIPAVLALSACVPSVYKLPYESGATNNFDLVDARAADEKTRANGSFLVTACDYAITRIEDGKTEPNRIEYLKYALSRSGLDWLAGKKVVVKSFTLFDNGQALERKDAINAAVASGAQAAANMSGTAQYATQIASPTSNYGCTPPLDKGGFVKNENPSFQPASIVNLIVSVDDHDYSTRVVEPANHDGSTIYRRAITKAVDQLISNMAKP